MSKTIKLRKGLNIPLKGEADKIKTSVDNPDFFAIKPTDFHGLVPKMTVKVGDKVEAGSVIFHDKYRDVIKYLSPVSGEIADIVRGAKRRILEVRIKPTDSISYADLGTINASSASREDVVNHLLKAGVWPMIKMRPLDIVANPEDEPKAIFISAFDSAPLAPDYDFVLHGENEAFQAGIDVLKRLTSGTVHLTVRGDGAPDTTFTGAKGVQLNSISGKHPVGNVGTQIHHIDPINKGEVVWVVNPQDVAIIGRIVSSGKYDVSKVVALTGSEVKNPKYVKTIIGTSISKLLENNVKEGGVRYISGNALTGTKIPADGFLGFYDSQITILPEGDEPKFMMTKGWMSPGFGRYSINHSYFSWLTPNKKRVLDTNLNGEVRAFVVTGELERVFPFDIYPMQLIKSAIYKDIDLMENLGIYEVAPEDFALCEFVCTSKIEIQDIIRNGLDDIQRECM